MTKQEREAWLKRQWPCTVWRTDPFQSITASPSWVAAPIASNLEIRTDDPHGHGESPGEAFLDLVRVMSQMEDKDAEQS